MSPTKNVQSNVSADQKEWECALSQQAKDSEACAGERLDHMARETFQKSEQESWHAGEVWPDAALEKGRLAPGF